MKKPQFILMTLLFICFLFGTAKAQNNSNKKSQQVNADEKYYQSKEVDEKIKIISKPRPSTDGNCTENSGRVSLRVYFHSSGKINKVEKASSSSCNYFDESAINVARQIKFKPAIKDGQAVSYVTIVEYVWESY